MRTPLLLAASLSLLAACNSNKPAAAGEGKSPGPATIVIPDVRYDTDAATVQKGAELFAAKGCQGCHKIGGGKLVGPDLEGVTARRDIKWLAKMILKPDVMLREDETARELLKTYMAPMANQNIDPATELLPLLGYLKVHETK